MKTTGRANVGRRSSFIGMTMAGVIAAMLPFLLAIIPGEAKAQDNARSGKQIVDTVCIACHGPGANGAPKIGDEQAWSKRASQGLTGLTQNALKGIRQMPAHGGSPSLTDFEIERAITYMVNQSGGHWTEPIDYASAPAERSGEQIVSAQCEKCHKTGVGGAPKIGDQAAWIPRVQHGLDALVRSGINGHGGMPPRGGKADLTDAEIRSAVVYMFTGGAVIAQAVPARKAATGQNFLVVGNTSVYFGVVSAALMRDDPKNYPESVYGAAPPDSDQFYVTVSLFDADNGQRITGAVVRARVSTREGSGPEKTLAPVTIANAQTHGNYFAMAGPGTYTITLHIRRPGATEEIRAQFEYSHL